MSSVCALQEYRYWLLTLVKLLAAEGQEGRLRAILDDLMASGRPQLPGGLERARLLQEALAQVATNLALQRLYSEYRYRVGGGGGTGGVCGYRSCRIRLIFKLRIHKIPWILFLDPTY